MRKYFIILLFLLPFGSSYSQNIDINLLKDINLNRNKHLDGVFKGVTHSATAISFGVPVLLFGYSYLGKDSITKKNAIYLGSTVITATAISFALKYITNRPRPASTYPFIEKLTDERSPSFPSGHTSEAFALATSLSLTYRKWYITVPSLVWAGTVGYSRMDLGVHYPSDVLMGAIVGIGSGYLCYKAQKWLHKKWRK